MPEIFANLGDGFVLLVNAREEKGYDLLLEVASLCGDIEFVAVASQSDLREARGAAEARGLANVRIISRTAHVAELYERCRVVVVPSYRFVETFSRVCIEAHRFGKPVIGSDVGNVPRLLAKSGIVLPRDAGAWATELRRLYSDQSYYEARADAARENSRRFSYAQQYESVRGVLGAAQRPVLVGVGSGIGNMLHVGPMVRRLSEHYGRRVDVVVAEDHGNSLFLLHNRRWVNSVYSLRQVALARRYDTVFLTHSFGSTRVPFQARRVVWSRDWDSFGPSHPLHETHFNLEAAKQLLGVDYGPESLSHHYVGELEYTWPRGRLVGLHGGSKGGFWASKRWPYYSELASALVASGYRVASFGTANEYVDGTENLTGGTIQEMAKAMCACSYFVSNDSGVMNVANAMGVPLLSIFGPTNVRTRGPLGLKSRAVSLRKDCAPCECVNRDMFVSGRCRCIEDVSLDEVLSAFQRLVVDQESSVVPAKDAACWSGEL